MIVDIVETGKTLKENGLEEKETILHSSARVISNKNSFIEKKEEILKLIEQIKAVHGA